MNSKNNRQGAILKSWNVIYPIFVYFVSINIATNVFAILATLLVTDYHLWYMAIQTAAVVVTLPFIYRYYKKDKEEPTVFQQHLSNVFQEKSKYQKRGNGVLMFLAGAFWGVGLNNIMAMTMLEQKSEGYQEVTKEFFAGGIFFELLGACLLIPILEELLYRSVVYGRICDLMIPKGQPETEKGRKHQRKTKAMAIVMTSFIFGVMHMNLVQLIYATLLGLLLSWFVEKSGHLYGAIAAHIGANLMSVLRMETKVFGWMESSKNNFIIVTIGCIIVGIGIVFTISKLNKEKCKG
ncbi:MAG: CPBP family intramembrane glutamic endopeptidase [Lachnospiraceae bacterium]